MVRALNSLIDRWWTQPEPNAAGRMALFRIVFGLFYLWTQAPLHYSAMGDFPKSSWIYMDVIAWVQGPPSGLFFAMIEVLLIASLVFLTLGCFTRAATLCTLILGFIITTFKHSIGYMGHGDSFMVVYIPAIMLFTGWGSNFSVDAVRRVRAGAALPEPTDSSWRYAWGMYTVLVLLVFMFVVSGIIKVEYGLGSYWLDDNKVMLKIIGEHQLYGVRWDYPVNGVNTFLVNDPVIYRVLRYAPLFFEIGFFLALINKRLRNWFMAMALLFHTFNAFILYLPFTHFIIHYLMFIDWYALYRRVFPASFATRLGAFVQRFTDRQLIAGVVILAASIALLWNVTEITRLLFGTFEVINYVTVWYPVGVFAAAWFTLASLNLLRDSFRWISVKVFQSQHLSES